MNFHFSRKQLTIFLLSLLIIMGSYLLVYFVWIKPAELKVTQTEQQLKTEQLLLARVVQPGQTDKVSNGTSDFVLKQLPVKPLVDEYMLELTKAEGISGVTIRNITLQETAQTNGTANSTNTNGATGTTTTQSTTNQTNNTATQASTNQKQATSAPVPITLNIDVQYNVYEQLQSFLKELEGMQRITYVQGIAFQGRDEVTQPNTKITPYHCILQIAVYYMPSMKDLEQGVPSIQLPPLCKNRSNPVEPQQCK
ncbi:hypothetical protein [Ectobacillus sp. sgz5001026]|uniref:hypothetical protein n=1 Tax=Ectobacillus sp. sgz5001026 TaxID=3242473 RepID=UPI0036D31305